MVLPGVEQLAHYVERPLFLLLLAPLTLLLLFVVTKNFGKHDISEEARRRITKIRFLVFFMRFLAFALLLIALSSPFWLYEKVIGGAPSVIFLLDNSTSFDLFEKGKGNGLYEQLKSHVAIDLLTMGGQLSSPLGDDIIHSLRKGGNILVMSDGQTTKGSSLGDASLLAQELNATINVIQMAPVKEDYSVALDGPSKISSGVETEYAIRVAGGEKKEHTVTVSIDGKEEFTKRVSDEFLFVKTFSEGYHTIKAEFVLDNDYFKENNVFYKTVKVIKKPKVTFVTSSPTPLQALFAEVYNIHASQTLGVLGDSYTLLLNDIPAYQVESSIGEIRKFVSDGNGLVVFGGLNSFDRGGYKGSLLEDILPVSIAGAEKEAGATSVVILIDISQSFAIDPGQEGGNRYGEGDIGVSKALAINLIDGIKKDDYLGVIAFDSKAYVVSDLGIIFLKDLDEVKSKIASLQPAIAGETNGAGGIVAAVEMLKNGAGAKNIVLISDGLIQKKDQFLAAAQYAADQGVTIYTIGVGETTNEGVMEQVAALGGGSYFTASQKNKVKILFSDGESRQQDSYAVLLRDRKHFITQGLDIGGRVRGFNEAVPKTTAQLLAVTDYGDPLVVAWRYGLGRVVVVLTDDGDIFAADLLNKKNSKLLLRALSWTAGDPERKQESFIDIRDSYAGEPIEVVYKGDALPQGEVHFSKVGEDVYSGSIEAREEGFHTLFGASYAVNSPLEYRSVGFNEELLLLASSTAGKVFEVTHVAEIAEAIKEQSQSSSLEKWQYQLPFVLLALLVFLAEVCIRRVLYFKG